MPINVHTVVADPVRREWLRQVLRPDHDLVIVCEALDVSCPEHLVHLFIIDLGCPYAALPMFWIAQHTIHPGAQRMALLDQSTDLPLVQLAWQGGAYHMAGWDDPPERLRRVAHQAALPGAGYVPLGVALAKMLQISETLDWAARDSHLSVLQIDLAGCRVLRGGQDLHLSPSEFAAVSALAHKAGQVMSHAELSRYVWGSATESKDDRVKRLVYRLRRRVELDAAHPLFIHSHHGKGYWIPAERVRLIQ